MESFFKKLKRGAAFLLPLLYLLLPAFLLYLCEAMAAGTAMIFRDVHFSSFLFSLLVVYGLFLGMFFLTRSFFWALLSLAAPLLIFGYADHMKQLILGERFYPWDLLMAGNLKDFFAFIGSFIKPSMIVMFVVILIFLVIAKKADVRLPFRAPASLVLSAVPLCLVFSLLFNSSVQAIVLPRFGIDPSDSLYQAQNYEKNGFLAAFCVNLASADISAPVFYSDDDVAQVLMNFSPDKTSMLRTTPDVIVILSEALFDLHKLEGYSYSEDPLKNFKRIAAAGVSGEMLTPTLGGGTIRPEFEVLTGGTTAIMPSGALPYQQYVRSDTWSYARYFKELGYDTVGVHTFHGNFYERDRAYPLLGFDEFYGLESLHVPVEFRGRYTSDATFADEMIYQLSQERDNPLFLFGISMENHGLYYQKYTDEDMYVRVEKEGLSDEEILVMENYASGVKHADDALGELYDFIQTRERPTVLLYFGDHLPALYEEYQSFTKGNMLSTGDSTKWTREDMLNMYSTPYLIAANFETEQPYRAEGKLTSDYFLMPLLQEYVGLPQTSLGNFLLYYYEVSGGYDCPALGLNDPSMDRETRVEAQDLHKSLSAAMLKGTYLGEQIRR